MNHMKTKADVRRELKEAMAGLTPLDHHRKSLLACNLLVKTPEFDAARVVMLYLSVPQEVDTAPLALKCWQAGKTVVVPKVSWDQRRMLPVEISSLQTGMTTSEQANFREPIAGKPIPLDMLDLVIVPGLGFTPTGHRIGRGMGFYDRFLAQEGFNGISCGLGFEEQVVEHFPVQGHDVQMEMLVTDRRVARFASRMIPAR